MARAAILSRKAGLSSALSLDLATGDAVSGVPSVPPVRNGPMSQPQVALRARDGSVKVADPPLTPDHYHQRVSGATAPMIPQHAAVLLDSAFMGRCAAGPHEGVGGRGG
jgi:hypothetical protein